MRVGVAIAGLSVSSPTGMTDTRCLRKAMPEEVALQFCDFAFFPVYFKAIRSGKGQS